MAENKLQDLLLRQSSRVQSVLNILVESAYFYRTDDEELFAFLLRYKKELTQFYKEFYDWDLVYDNKCARVFKRKWYNPSVTEGKRRWFKFTRRDECLAFMLLLEFFEQQLEEQNMSVEDAENMRFYFGDLLSYTHRRLQELYPGMTDTYTMDAVRKILKDVIPELEQYRLLLKIKADAGERVTDDQVIFEALPAIYHYNATRLSYPVFSNTEVEEEETDAE
ncbi:DUF2398 family protein [uncultured Desulfobulbus sp.]|uniref:DUF2398 family protein n=1 Tax=uncultured Desulfobulbus sp. TaxID=239745 RepID=UPI0029C6DFCD|nr:DUF2398 family protein [uncultured Desulfobulbus sp.]